jgi:hypothetical protein
MGSVSALSKYTLDVDPCGVYQVFCAYNAQLEFFGTLEKKNPT